MTDPEQWGARFQSLATEAGQGYARSVRRYHELLDRVARGQLRPEQVQQVFRSYLEEQATPATRAMVELSVGLLAGLLHTEARYRDALLDGLLPAETPPPPPPAPDGADITVWFQILSTYAAQQSARSMARYQRLIERVAAGDIPPGRVDEHGRRFLERQSPQFLGDVMALGLDFVERLQRSSAAISDGLYDRVLGPEAAPAAAEPPVCLDLRGPSGSIASVGFVIENTRPAPAEVACDASPFAPRTGGGRLPSRLTITPARAMLAPGERQTVRLDLPLDAGVFEPGHDYVASLVITGAGDRTLVVQLMARADAPASPGPVRPTEPTPAASPGSTPAPPIGAAASPVRKTARGAKRPRPSAGPRAKARGTPGTRRRKA